jgi:hypothetical protein
VSVAVGSVTNAPFGQQQLRAYLHHARSIPKQSLGAWALPQEQEKAHMTLQDQYANGARTVGKAWTDAATSWTGSIKDAAGQARTPFAMVNATALITQSATLARQLQQANLEYAVNLLRAVSVAGDAAGQYLDSVGSVLRNQVNALSDSVHEQVTKTEQIVQEQAERAEVRQARAAERREARQAHQTARERYEGKTKTELADELSTRGLPKTGNLDELIDRLADADTM